MADGPPYALALAIRHCRRAPMLRGWPAGRSAVRKQRKTYEAKRKGGEMIVSIRGEVLDVALDHVVIEACGVGDRVNATPSTLATCAAAARSGSSRRWSSARTRDAVRLRRLRCPRPLPELLQSVNRVGPRFAMATLAVPERPTSCAALGDGDLTALTRVPGVGKRKVAERSSLELRDKSGPSTTPVTLTVLPGGNGYGAGPCGRGAGRAWASRPARPRQATAGAVRPRVGEVDARRARCGRAVALGGHDRFEPIDEADERAVSAALTSPRSERRRHPAAPAARRVHRPGQGARAA